jgi:hypothetical protein
MKQEHEGCVRLWQAVATQALLDGSTANPSKAHRYEARAFVAGSTFTAICEQTNLNAQALRERMDDPFLFERLQEYRGGRERGA